MKFAVFFEQSVTDPSDPEATRQVYLQNVEQAVLAEELGFDQAWVVEHYFLEGYSHSSSPETFLAYLAAVTSKIRLCHGVRILLPEVTHPARVAMQAAYLDVISGGRLEFGTGRQTTWTEMGAFGVHPDDTKDVWDEVVRAIPRMWTDEEFECEGKFFKFPPRALWPKPYQKPHPPLWVAVQSPETATIAGERGLGFLGVSFGEPEAYEPMVTAYREAIQGCTPVGAFVNEQVNGATWLYCAETDELAKAEGGVAADTYFANGKRQLGVGSVYPTPAYRRFANAVGGSKELIRSDMLVGSPESCIAAVKRWEAIGVDRMCCLLGYDQITPQEKILESMRLFAREVMPAFEASEPTSIRLGTHD